LCCVRFHLLKRVWRYQRGYQNPYIEEEQTIQWPKEKVRKENPRSTKHAYKTKDRVTRTPLKTGCELRCSGRVSSSCSTSGARRVNLVTNSVTSREWGKKVISETRRAHYFLYLRFYYFPCVDFSAGELSEFNLIYLVNRYGVSVSQMTTDMFCLS
jgi:hypothetical protein